MSGSDEGPEVDVRGGASPYELAAVLAVLSRTSGGRPPEDAYRLWRTGRLAALRRRVARRD